MIDRIQFSTGAAVGSAGSATATGYSIHTTGKVLAVHVDYQHAPPAGTTDFTLTTEDDPAAEAIVSLVDQSTDIKLHPRRVLEKNDGTDLTFYGHYIVCGRLKATIAQADALDYCVVTVWLEDTG